MTITRQQVDAWDDEVDAAYASGVAAGAAAERERFLQAVEEMRPVQSNPILQSKPPKFWIDAFEEVIRARQNT